jgi:two-component system, cell cycle response regulator CpdR
MARILVAEDDDGVRDLLQALLELDQHHVQTAADGLDALDKYEAGSFDLVCTDLDMPRLNGIELSLAIRSSARAQVPILMITGSASDRDLDEARSAGISDLLGKPFGPPALQDRVAALLSATPEPA